MDQVYYKDQTYRASAVGGDEKNAILVDLLNCPVDVDVAKTFIGRGDVDKDQLLVKLPFTLTVSGVQKQYDASYVIDKNGDVVHSNIPYELTGDYIDVDYALGQIEQYLFH